MASLRHESFLRSEWYQDKDKQRSIFLVSTGAKTYKLIRSLLAPEDPKRKSYEDLAKLVQDHCMPKPSAIVQHWLPATRWDHSIVLSRVKTSLRTLGICCNFWWNATGPFSVWRAWQQNPTPPVGRTETVLKKSAWAIAVTWNSWERCARFTEEPNPRGESHSKQVWREGRGQKGTQTESYEQVQLVWREAQFQWMPFQRCQSHGCGKVGHISRSCRSKEKGTQKSTNKARRQSSYKPQSAYRLEGGEIKGGGRLHHRNIFDV